MREEFPNFQPHIAYIFSHFNSGNFRKFYKYLDKKYGIKINEFTFGLEHSNITPKWNKKDHMQSVLRKNIMKDIKFILDEFKSYEISIRQKFYEYYLKNIPNFLDYPRKQMITCSACKLFAFINPHGWVYPCAIWKEKIGNLKKRSFYEIWNSPKAKNIRGMIKERQCPNCWLACTAQVNIFENIAKNVIMSKMSTFIKPGHYTEKVI